MFGYMYIHILNHAVSYPECVCNYCHEIALMGIAYRICSIGRHGYYLFHGQSLRSYCLREATRLEQR